MGVSPKNKAMLRSPFDLHYHHHQHRHQHRHQHQRQRQHQIPLTGILQPRINTKRQSSNLLSLACRARTHHALLHGTASGFSSIGSMQLVAQISLGHEITNRECVHVSRPYFQHQAAFHNIRPCLQVLIPSLSHTV
jgi:hypothetical protein